MGTVEICHHLLLEDKFTEVADYVHHIHYKNKFTKLL